MIKQGKKEFLNTMENEIEGLYKENTYSVDKLSEYCNEWKEAYKGNDYEGMEQSMNKITQRLKQSKIVEETITEARNIEKIQEFINEKGSLDNLTDNEKELLEKIK